MKNKVTDIIDKYSMIEDGDSICVALSGGADSVSLFNFFVQNKDILRLSKLYACHLNHNLRGEESDRDESFVKMLCVSNKVELFTKSVDINALCQTAGKSLEETARNARYDFFREIHEKYGCKIATAHTLSDCMETAIFNLSRGTGLKGLCGITPKRDYIIRPLIRCSRSEIEKYCCENELEFVTDSTNDTDIYTRNKIRHRIIPKLYELNPAVETAFIRFFAQSESEQDYMDIQTEEAYEKILDGDRFSRQEFLSCHKAIGYRLLAKILVGKNVEVSFSRLELLYEYVYSGRGSVQLNSELYLKVKAKYFEITDNIKPPEYFEEKIDLDEAEETAEVIVPDGKKVVLKLIQYEQNIKFENTFKKDLKNCFDYDKIEGSILIRQKKEGDKITLDKRGCTKSLKKLFNEMKIPTEKRGVHFIICDDNDVLWVEGAGRAQKVSIDKNTRRLVKISVEE